jgi:hypothetical protein
VPPSMVSDELKQCTPMYESVKMQRVRGRGGRPIDIQTHMQGDIGTTDIHIAEVDDSVIQERFKRLDDHAPENGYSRECSLCRGRGINAITKGPCPKCKGSGMSVI